MRFLRSVVFCNRALAALLAVAFLIALVVDDQQGVHAALVALAVTALVALGGLKSTIVLAASTPPCPPAEERRLRGGFRRQHRPDSPGRPMPRAPGQVI